MKFIVSMDSRQRIPSKSVISRVKDLTILKRCEQIVRLEKRTDMTGDADVCGITVIVVTTVIAVTTARAERREQRVQQ